ncbi:MAG: hypothetical protein ACYTXR_20195, partial [Nostoc sp.]
YMMANPNPSKPVFGMVTNGDDILFVKVMQTNTPQYDLSRFLLRLYPRENCTPFCKFLSVLVS